MGGSLAVTIRDPEGKWHKMDRWTNPTSHVFTDQKFLDGDKETLDEYLKVWHDMVEDFDKKEDKFNMSECYADPHHSSRDKIAPSEYGLVYIDFINKRFYSMQGYTSYDQMADIHITFRAQYDENKEYWDSVAKRIRAKAEFSWDADKNQTETRSEVSFDAFPALLKDAETNKEAMKFYYLDMGEWDFKDFTDDRDGAKQMFEELSLYHRFSETEKKIWASWRNDDEDEE